MIIDNRIAGTRVTVWDVLHHFDHDWPTEDVAEVLGLSEPQVQAAVDYIQTHRTEVMKVHQQIEQRNARGNPPDVQAKLNAARAGRLKWAEQRQKSASR